MQHFTIFDYSGGLLEKVFSTRKAVGFVEIRAGHKERHAQAWSSDNTSHKVLFIRALEFTRNVGFQPTPMMHLESEAWYCARTKPKHEHLVAANLSRNHGLEVFHPRLRLERSTQRGVVRVVESLFPCYIFVRCNVEQKADEIRYVSGMSSLVRFGDKIAVVPDDVIEELGECFQTDEPLPVVDQLNSGTEVTVAGGAFTGFDGIVLRVLPAKQRVQVLLDFLGRTTVAEVDRKSLKTDRRIADLVPTLAAAGLISVAASLSQHK